MAASIKDSLGKIVLFLLAICISGCATTKSSLPHDTDRLALDNSRANFNEKSPFSNKYHEFKPKRAIQRPSRIRKRPRPRFKELSPLDIQMVSISFTDEDYKAIFQALAKAAGLNLVIDESAQGVLSQGKRLTAEFSEQPVRTVLDAVCKTANLSWEEENGILFIKGRIEKIFDLDFIASTHQARVTVGGDVLGGQGSSGGGGGGGSQGITAQGEGELATPLTGSFEITGETSPGATDIYKEIDDAIKGYLKDKGKYFLNRNTGTLFVQGPPKIVARIGDYIKKLKEKYQRQCLIEARILEIELDNSFELGIDWRHLTIDASDKKINPEGTTFNLDSQLLEGLRESAFYGITITNPYYSLSTVVRALEQFGKVHALSNPRLKVLNGQPAMISVGQSVSYLRKFEIIVDQQQGFRSETPNTEISSIFNGILLGVTPIIDEKGNVTLNMVPIKSDIISMEERELTDGNLYTFPVVNLREASTTVRAQSGDIIILGGLIEDRIENETNGLPFLSRLPGILGAAFSYKSKKYKKVKLVIILKINVIEDEQTV